MAGKYLWFALFVTLQISFVLCRSAGKTDEEGKEFIVSPTGDVLKAEALKETVAPGEMTVDDKPMHQDAYQRAQEAYDTAVIVVVVLYFVFLFGSFTLGCILYMRSKARAVRPGRIVNSGTGVQSFGTTQPISTM